MDNYAAVTEKQSITKTVNDEKTKYVSVFYHVLNPPETKIEMIEMKDMNPNVNKQTEKSHLMNSNHSLNCQETVPDYLPLSILSVVLFLPFGIAALVHSLKVRDAIERKDLYSALHFSKLALQFGLISVMAGPFLAGVVVILFIFVMHS